MARLYRNRVTGVIFPANGHVETLPYMEPCDPDPGPPAAAPEPAPAPAPLEAPLAPPVAPSGPTSGPAQSVNLKTMTKRALVAYAGDRLGVTLDQRKTLPTLRAEVAALLETAGPRGGA